MDNQKSIQLGMVGESFVVKLSISLCASRFNQIKIFTKMFAN